MPTLKDIYNSLKSTIVGTQTKAIDSKLDKAIQDISAYKSGSGRNGYIELVRSLIAKVGQVDMGGAFFQTQTTPAALGQGSRLMRYKAYDAIVQNINYCHRALTVLVDNILSPDDITKTSLEIKSKKFIEEDATTQANCGQVKKLVEDIKLEEKLHLIVRNTLKFGDFFCEIADAKTALTSKAILQESWSEFQEQVASGIKERLEIEAEKQKELSANEDKYKKHLISQEQYEAQKKDISDKYAQKELDLKKKQANSDMVINF